MIDRAPAGEPSRTGVGALRNLLSLRGRLIALVCFATVPALLFTFAAAVRERDLALERLEAEARHLGDLASREHAHQLNGARALLDRLPEAASCSAGGSAARIDCPAYLGPLLSSLPQFANIGIADTDGNIVCSAVRLTQPASLRSNAAFERAGGSNAVEVGEYVVGFVGRPVLHLAKAVGTPGPRPCAVAFVAVELSWLDSLAEHANLPEDYSLLITDRTGRVLTSSGGPETVAGHEPGAAAPDLSAALGRPHGAVIPVGDPPSARYFVATPMEGLPSVYVVAGLPFARVQSTANRAFARTLAALVLVTLFIVASAILAAEFSVLRVLRSLTRAVRQFGAGDLWARPPLPGGRGELRELAIAFGSMADALAARQQEAEQARDRLRALSHRLQIARDEEAERIARELHDELGQVLTGLKIELGRIRRLQTDHRRIAEAAEAIGAMQGHLDEAIESLRRISAELRPPVLDRLGLAAALDWLVREWEGKSGLAIVLNVAGLDDEPVDEGVSIAIFRVVQEALTNVMRHAQATEVHVDLAAGPGAIVLTIEDNGRGFAPQSVVSPLAVGIHGMRERVQLLGGAFRIGAGSIRGTRIEVEVPRRAPAIDRPPESGRMPS